MIRLFKLLFFSKAEGNNETERNRKRFQFLKSLNCKKQKNSTFIDKQFGKR